MPEVDIIRATGTITKEENLITIDHSIRPNTLVLESSFPFPGYHGSNLPERPTPNSIFLVTAIQYDGEDILRKAKKIKKVFPENFDASFGKFQLSDKTYHFIRVRNIDCFGCIARLQAEFAREGIQFMKKKKINGEASIMIQKFFSFQKIGEHLYKDLDRSDMYYLEIPEKPEWQFFKKITFYIRGNIDNYSFDAALATVYLEDIMDMVRIYARDINVKQLQYVRGKYIYELTHPDHLQYT